MRLDIGELAALFHIHSEASKHGNNFKNIKDAAWDQLKALDAEHAKPEEDTSVEASHEESANTDQIERRV